MVFYRESSSAGMSWRRFGAKRTLAVVTPLVLVVLLLVSPGVASAAGPTLFFRPPYSVGLLAYYNTTTLSPCEAKASVPISPHFDNSTGRLALQLVASAGHGGPHCPYTSAFASAAGHIQFNSKAFTATSGGAKVVRGDWRLAWHASWNLSGVNGSGGVGCPVVCLTTWIGIQWFLIDLTTTATYSFPGTYTNSTFLSGVNSTNSQNYLAKLSLPILVPMTRGDSYQFEFMFDAYVTVGVGPSPISAIASMNFGSPTSTQLVEVTIR